MEETVQPAVERPEIINYRRRLDRSPCGDYSRLREDQMILISSLRTALENAKKRSDRLKEENEIKDDMIEEERQQRKCVEEKLQKYLVDVYNNPQINSELRQRLPRARNYDPLHVDVVNSDDLKVGEQIDSANTDKSYNKLLEDSIDPLMQASVVHGTLSSEQQAHDPNLTKASLSSPIGIGQTNFINGTLTQTQTAEQNQYPTSVLNQTSPYSDTFTYPGLPHFTASYSSINTGLSSSYLDLPQSGPVKQVEPVIQKEEKIKPHPSAVTYQELPSKDVPTLKEDDKIVKENFQIARSQIFSQAPMNMNTTTNYHYSQPYKPPTDNVSHITRFLAEISTLKKENQELKTDLENKNHDLEILKDELQQAKNDDDKDDSVAALIEMVHSAGKKREQALAQMVSSAVEDRDATLGELDRLRLKSSDKSFPCTSVSINDCSDLEEAEEAFAASGCVSIESELGDSRETLGTDVEPSLEELKNLLSRQRDIMQEEMKEVIRQRDLAHLKVAKLEKRLSSLELSEFSDDAVESLHAKLRVTETERDIALSKLRKMLENFGEIKLLNNLRQALVHDSLKDDSKLKQTEKNRHLDGDKWDAGKNNNMMISLNKQVEENSKLEKKIVLLEYQSKEQAQQIDKLQSLIKRQRQKLNALCAGPLLIED